MKPWKIKALSIAVQILPMLIVTGCYFPFIIQRPATMISFAAIVVLFIVGLILKDNLMKQFQSLNWTKTCLIVAVISGLAMYIAKPMLIVSLSGICGSVIAYPLEIKYKETIDQAKEERTLEKFKSVMRGDSE